MHSHEKALKVSDRQTWGGNHEQIERGGDLAKQYSVAHHERIQQLGNACAQSQSSILPNQALAGRFE
uniref:Uncharacterized protein n=1 Tax=Leersia perrieri TaxID=77586 RepID=A0A0D9V4F5_9ORYZ